jgi:hypothetical protein
VSSVGIAVALFVLLALAAPLVVSLLVREERERDAATVADCETAERAPRRDTRER